LLRRLPLLLIVAFCLAPASASAQAGRCQAPPGTSAIDQYCEVVPDGTGGSSTSGPGPKTPGLSRAAQAALSRQGADGSAVVSLAGGGSSAPARSSAGGQSPSQEKDQDPRPAGDHDVSGSGESRKGVLRAAASSASQETQRIGGAFIIVLLVALIAMGAWGWLRFRRSSVA
jgi:hypothetical protein